MAITARTFGQNLKALRQAAGISQEELAHRANIHRTYVSQIERGIKAPTVVVVGRLAKGLGCPPSKILRAMENHH
jgi:transcriptional regulator with XRE-family HTH domain